MKKIIDFGTPGLFFQGMIDWTARFVMHKRCFTSGTGPWEIAKETAIFHCHLILII